MFRFPTAVVLTLALATGAARADELCDFVNEAAAASPEDIKGEILEENVTIGNFTIYDTALRAPLDGFQPCVLEQRTKSSGDLSQLLVCHHGDGDEKAPLSEERFQMIRGQINDCTGKDGIGNAGRQMWMPANLALKRVDLVSNKEGARLVFVYPN